jgi:hypothetical protein
MSPEISENANWSSAPTELGTSFAAAATMSSTFAEPPAGTVIERFESRMRAFFDCADGVVETS